MLMPKLDFTLNIPTLIIGLGVLLRGWAFISRLEEKINIMWIQFLVEHPEYERRESLKTYK